MNLPKKTAVVTGVAGFSGGHSGDERMCAGGKGHEFEPSKGGEGFERTHHKVKVKGFEAVLAGSLRGHFPVLGRILATLCESLLDAQGVLLIKLLNYRNNILHP